MMKNQTKAYIRISGDKQTVKAQRDEISRYATKEKIIIDEFIEFEITSRKSNKERGIDDLIENLNSGDTLIVSELSRLGRSTQQVLQIIDTLLKKGITIIFLKQNLTVTKDNQDVTTKVMITLFSLFAELERDLISSRTTEALASRKGKNILGRKKDTLSKSMFDVDRVRIIELFNLGLSSAKIVALLQYGTFKSLLNWRDSRYTQDNLLKEFTANEKYKAFLLEKKL